MRPWEQVYCALLLLASAVVRYGNVGPRLPEAPRELAEALRLRPGDPSFEADWQRLGGRDPGASRGALALTPREGASMQRHIASDPPLRAEGP